MEHRDAWQERHYVYPKGRVPSDLTNRSYGTNGEREVKLDAVTGRWYIVYRTR